MNPNAQRPEPLGLPTETPPQSTMSGWWRPGLVAGVMLAMLLAACGGSNQPSNGVARLDSPSPDASSSADAGAVASAGASLSPDDVYQAMLAYSQCMRSHGVASFPDPVNQGGNIGLRISGGPGTGLDPDSATFKAAQQACQSLIPAPKAGTGGQIPEKAREQALQFSQCMRDHGLPDFPDPQFSNGGVSIGGPGQKGAGLDPNSATFQAAQQACESLMPGLSGGSTRDSSGAPTSSSQP